MSGFGGHMTIYRHISIDRFDKNNLKSTVFLLSHCHRDHMVGLNKFQFLRCLRSRNNVFLYCSEVTKLLLLSEAQFKPLAPYISVLEIGVPTTVTIPDPDSDEFKSVVITTLPAGHCLGSVMFLIEGKEGRALYTGDFRWEKNYATTLPALCVNGHIKEIDSMYVDTTFCIPEAFYIPSRDDCLSATASLVVAWLRQSPNRYVLVSSSTKYGHEPLLAHLAKEAETKVHTTKEKLEIYEQIKELRGVFTHNPCARIHACKWTENNTGQSSLPCGYRPQRESSAEGTEAPEVLVIRPSTMWFTNQPSRLQELVVAPSSGRGLHRVCYSFHSSYSEIRDLVSLLRPQQVYPNVLPASETDWLQVKERLRKFLTYKHQHHMAPVGDSLNARPLGLLKRKRKESVHNLTDSEGLVFDSPEKPKRARQDSSKDDEVLPSSQKSAASNAITPTKSDTHSSYQGSDMEEDMFANSEDGEDNNMASSAGHEKCADDGEGEETRNSQSLRSYVSGDEEVPEGDQVSSPQFRRLVSQDDKPEAQPDLCLDCDDPRTCFSPGDVDDVCEKDPDPDPESNVDPDLTSSNCTSLLSVVKEAEKSDARNSDVVEQSKKCDEENVEMCQCRDEQRCSACEKNGKKADDTVVPSSGCHLQETVPSSCGIGESCEEDCPRLNDCNGNLETKQMSKGDPAVGRENVVQNEAGQKRSEVELRVNTDSSHLNKDRADCHDIQPTLEHGDACGLELKVLDSETGDEMANARLGDGLQPYSSRDREKVCQVSPVHSEKPYAGSPDGKKTQGCCSEDGKKTQGCCSEDGKKTQGCCSEDGKKTQGCCSEDGKKTQGCCSEDGKKTHGCCADGKKTQRCYSENGKKTQKRFPQDGRKEQEADKSDQSHKEGSTKRRQQTNIISSDSDSDVDCQITRSFIRKRPVNPWQKIYPILPPPPTSSQPCPRHHRRMFLHQPSIQQKDAGFQHKLCANTSPDSKGELKSSTCRAEVDSKRSEVGVNTTTDKRTVSSIDLTLGENETDISADATEKKFVAVVKTEKDGSVEQCGVKDQKSEKTDRNPFMNRFPKRDFLCAAEDADVEDNAEEDADSRDKTKISTCGNIFSKSKTVSGRSSEVIVIEDAEDSVSGRTKHNASSSTRAKASNTSVHNAPLNTQSQPPHKCSAKPGRNSKPCHQGSQSHSPFKQFHPKHPMSSPETKPSPVKGARSNSDHGSSVFQSLGKEPNHSSCPKKTRDLTNGSKQERHLVKENGSCGASTSKGDPDAEKNKEKGMDEEEVAEQTKGGSEELLGECKDQEGEKGGEDSDVTLPPDSLDSTLPPDSPVAVHSSDSDSDTDCKITQSFITHSLNRSQPSAFRQYHHQARCPMSSSLRQQSSAPPPHPPTITHTSQSAVPSLGFPQLGSAGRCPMHSAHRAQPQGGARPPSKGTTGEKTDSASSVPLTKEKQQASVIDLTEDD